MNDLDYPELSVLVDKRVLRRNTTMHFEDDENSSEVGIILHAWIDHELGVVDCYVAFFGEAWPNQNEKLQKIPYVLRYFLSSLEEVL